MIIQHSGSKHTPKNATILGCLSVAMILVSRINSNLDRGSNSTENNCLIATSVFCHRPLYTNPEPPPPIFLLSFNFS